MNILFGAIFIILLLFPGILFRASYLAIAVNSKSFRSTILEELLFSLVPAFLFQLPGYFAANIICDVNEKILFLLFINSDKLLNYSLGAWSVAGFFLYTVIINALAFYLGNKFREYSIKTKLHLSNSFFRIYNEWQVYFDGWILDRIDVPGEQSTMKLKWLDVLVENKDDAYIYSGFLQDYVIDRDEKLDRIYLTAVRRRKLSADPGADNVDHEEIESGLTNVDYANDQEIIDKGEQANSVLPAYYYMPGDYFLILGTEIKNINITYFYDEDENSQGASSNNNPPPTNGGISVSSFGANASTTTS